MGTGRLEPAVTRGAKGRYLTDLMEDPGQPVSADMAGGARRRRVYLDTSAYLCILLAEEGWKRFVTLDSSQQQAAKELGLPA